MAKRIEIAPHDLTKCKGVVEAQITTEGMEALILCSISELVVRQDKQHRVLWANRAAAESAGLSLEQLVRRRCYEIWHQRSQPCVGCPVSKVLETGPTM